MTFQITTLISPWNEYGCFDGNASFSAINDAEAVDVALRNLASQADDTYFDGMITFEINGERFHVYDNDFDTTALLMTWNDLIRFKDYEENGESSVLFLDRGVDFFIVFWEQGYQLKTFHSEHQLDENNVVLSTEITEVLSEMIPKRLFEEEIKKAAGLFIEFCEKNHLPVNADKLNSLKKSYAKDIGE